MIGFITTLLAAVASTPDAATVPLDSIAWFPANTVEISGAPADKVPILSWLRGYIRTLADAEHVDLPGCLRKLTAPVVASYQIWRDGHDESSAVLLQGALDRESVETCMARTLEVLGTHPTMLRSEAITEVRTDGFGRFHLGWGRSWTIWHNDRSRVQEILSALGTNSIAPSLRSTLERTDRSAAMWGASVRDYSSVVFGVPSRAMSASLRTRQPDTIVRFSFEFGSPEAARRAAQALTKVPSRQDLPPKIRSFARTVRSSVVGQSLELQLGPKFQFDDETIAAFQAVIDQKRQAQTPPARTKSQ